MFRAQILAEDVSATALIARATQQARQFDVLKTPEAPSIKPNS